MEYPKLRRERDCARHVKTLKTMCDHGELRKPAPESLQVARDEYHERIKKSD